MELALGYKLPVAWHLGDNLYDQPGGIFYPGTTAVGRLDGSSNVDATDAFTEGRGAILIAQPGSGPWEASLVDGVNSLNSYGGSSHLWMSPSICEDGNERWVVAMGRTGLNELSQDLSLADVWSPYHQEGTTPGYGHVLYGDDGREPRFFKTQNFSGKTAAQISMLLVELAQYISDNLLTASDTYPAFDRTLGGATTPAQYENNARIWCSTNAIAIMNDYLTGCGAGETTTTTTRKGETTTTTTAANPNTTTTTAAPTTTTTTAAPTTTTTTAAPQAEPCYCYDLTNNTPEPITLLYTDCSGQPNMQETVPGLTTVQLCARAYDEGNGDIQTGNLTVTANGDCRLVGEAWTCCPTINITWNDQAKTFTLDCVTSTDLITLVVTGPTSILTLGDDYTIAHDPETGCLIVTILSQARAGQYTFTINDDCNYVKLIN